MQLYLRVYRVMEMRIYMRKSFCFLFNKINVTSWRNTALQININVHERRAFILILLQKTSNQNFLGTFPEQKHKAGFVFLPAWRSFLSCSITMPIILFCRRICSWHWTSLFSHTAAISSPAAASRCRINSLQLRMEAIFTLKNLKMSLSPTRAELTG